MKSVGVPRTSPDASPLDDIALNACLHLCAGAVTVEPWDVEPELGCVASQVVVLERLLAMEEQLVHLPEASLERRSLSCGSSCEGVRMDLREREVPKHESNPSPSRCSTRSIARNAWREYGHS